MRPRRAASRFRLILGTHDQQDIARPCKRTAQQHETLGQQPVHEVGMGAPIALLLHWLVVVPVRSSGIDDGEYSSVCHGYTRVKSMIQLVSQLLPSSSEKACSQRAESPVMRDHR